MILFSFFIYPIWFLFSRKNVPLSEWIFHPCCYIVGKIEQTLKKMSHFGPPQAYLYSIDSMLKLEILSGNLKKNLSVNRLSHHDLPRHSLWYFISQKPLFQKFHFNFLYKELDSWNVFISCTSPWYIISQNHISKSFLKIFAKNLC